MDDSTFWIYEIMYEEEDGTIGQELDIYGKLLNMVFRDLNYTTGLYYVLVVPTEYCISVKIIPEEQIA